MKLTINDDNYRVYFRYKSVEEFEMKTKTLVHSNRTIQKTVISGTKHIVEAILIDADTNELMIKGVSTCSMYDVYNKRLGMAMAIENLLQNLYQFVESDDDSKLKLMCTIFDTHFGFHKNKQYNKGLTLNLTK